MKRKHQQFRLPRQIRTPHTSTLDEAYQSYLEWLNSENEGVHWTEHTLNKKCIVHIRPIEGGYLVYFATNKEDRWGDHYFYYGDQPVTRIETTYEY